VNTMSLIREEFKLWEALSDNVYKDSTYKAVINSELQESGIGFSNLVLKLTQDQKISSGDASKLKSMFNQHKSKGNFIRFNSSDGEDNIVETGRYYYLNEVKIDELDENCKILKTNDIESFGSIVRNGFCYDDGFETGFIKRMRNISDKLDCHFYLMSVKNNIVGATSFFKHDSQLWYFMMNTCVLPKYRGLKYSTALISQSHRDLCAPVYARTSNPVMETSLLSLGYEETDTFQILSLDTLV